MDVQKDNVGSEVIIGCDDDPVLIKAERRLRSVRHEEAVAKPHGQFSVDYVIQIRAESVLSVGTIYNVSIGLAVVIAQSQGEVFCKLVAQINVNPTLFGVFLQTSAGFIRLFIVTAEVEPRTAPQDETHAVGDIVRRDEVCVRVE